MTPAPATTADVAAAQTRVRVREALGLGTDITAVEPLTGGLYNAAHLVTLADGRRFILKSAPPSAVPGLTHEHGLLGTETLFHTLAAAVGVPVPEVVHHRPATAAAGEWLLLTYLDGRSWHAAQDDIPVEQRSALRHALGAAVARIPAVTGDYFGYPQPGPGLRADTWPAAFAAMLHAVLADADRYGADLPVPRAALADLPDRFAGFLSEIDRPALVHFDAWPGNVIVRPDAGTWSLVGLIDGERAFFGDPLAEVVNIDPFGAAEADPDFLAGYHATDPTLDVESPSARVRLALYRIYLALIMRVESIPRAYDAEHLDFLLPWTQDRIRSLFGELDAT